jgi:hypothetical protein
MTSDACCGIDIKNRFFLAATVGQSSISTSSSMSTTTGETQTSSTATPYSTLSTFSSIASTWSPTAATGLPATSLGQASSSPSGFGQTTTPSPASSDLSTAEKIGIGAGVGLGALALGGIGVIAFLLWRRQRPVEREDQIQKSPWREHQIQEVYGSVPYRFEIQELDGTTRYEASTGSQI